MFFANIKCACVCTDYMEVWIRNAFAIRVYVCLKTRTHINARMYYFVRHTYLCGYARVENTYWEIRNKQSHSLTKWDNHHSILRCPHMYHKQFIQSIICLTDTFILRIVCTDKFGELQLHIICYAFIKN